MNEFNTVSSKGDYQIVYHTDNRENYLEVQEYLRMIINRDKRYYIKQGCKYCGGDMILYTHEDRNVIGDKGFTTTLQCKGCTASVSVFSPNYKGIITAKQKVLDCFGIKKNTVEMSDNDG